MLVSLIALLLLNLHSTLATISGQNRAPLKTELPASTKCIFIGCACSAKNVITCPLLEPDESPYRLTMFPKRYNGNKQPLANITLDLAGNQLEKIPDDRFAGLDMFSLDLSRNQIFKLSPEMFRDIKRLETLDLRQNQLKFLSVRVFEPIKACLSTLSLDENSLYDMQTSMLSRVFADFPGLRHLHLSKNRLVHIPNLTRLNLTRLSLASNSIDSLIDPDSYLSLLPESLVYLDLESNRIKHVNDFSLANLARLEELNLASNRIGAFAENSFANLKSLRVLNLRQNNMMHIPSRIFYSLVNLEDLDFSRQGQAIKQIADYALDRQSNVNAIRRVDLSGNRIQSIQNRAFCSKNYARPYANVREIDIGFNSIQKVNACIMRQLTKGSRARVTVKLTQSVECDCEVTRIGKLLDLHGSCQIAGANSTVVAKNYDCGMGDPSIRNLNLIHAHCAKLTQYECAMSPDLDFNHVDMPTSTVVSTSKGKSAASNVSNSTYILSTLPLDRNSSSVFGDNDNLKDDYGDTVFNVKNDTLKSSSSSVLVKGGGGGSCFFIRIFYLNLLVVLLIQL